MKILLCERVLGGENGTSRGNGRVRPESYLPLLLWYSTKGVALEAI